MNIHKLCGQPLPRKFFAWQPGLNGRPLNCAKHLCVMGVNNNQILIVMAINNDQIFIVMGVNNDQILIVM